MRTWQEISDQLGYRTESGARRAVGRFIASTRITPEEARRSKSETLRTMGRDLYDRFEIEVAPGGDLGVALELAKEIRSGVAEAAKLEDLYSPKRVEVTVSQEPTAVWDRLEGELRAALAVAQPRRLPPPILDAEVIPDGES